MLRDLAIRKLPPPLPRGCGADCVFTMRVQGAVSETSVERTGCEYFLAFAYRYSGEGFEARRAHRDKVGLNRADLDVQYDAVRTVNATTPSGPLEYITCRGKAEWLQQCVFQRINQNVLVNTPERRHFHIPVVNSDLTADQRTRPGSLVVLMLRFDTHVKEICNGASLRSMLIHQASAEKDRVHVICPVAIVPSGFSHYKLVDQYPPNLRQPFIPNTVSLLQVPEAMHLHTNRDPTIQEQARAALYPEWYGQYLVVGTAAYVQVWPTPHGTRIRSMRDGNSPLPDSIDAAHCLLAGLVRFHCERSAAERDMRSMRFRTSSSNNLNFAPPAPAAVDEMNTRLSQLVYECVYTPTVLHRTMSLRQLVREQGFAALCRNVYFALRVHHLENPPKPSKNAPPPLLPTVRAMLPTIERQSEWFVETLGYLMSYVIASETATTSENETLRILQLNGLCEYPSHCDDRFVPREQVISESSVPFAARNPEQAAIETEWRRAQLLVAGTTLQHVEHPEERLKRMRNGEPKVSKSNASRYPIEVHRCNSDANDAKALTFYRRFRKQTGAVPPLSEVLWMFTMDFQIYLAARRSTSRAMRFQEVFMVSGRVYLLWYHFTEICNGNEYARETLSEAVFSLSPANQPWLAEFFITALVTEDTLKNRVDRIVARQPAHRGFETNAEKEKRQRVELIVNSYNSRESPFLMTQFKCDGSQKITAFVRSLRSGADAEPPPLLRYSKRFEAITRPSLLRCLPMSSGKFAASRPRYLRDVPLSGTRSQQYVEKYRVNLDARSIDCNAAGSLDEPDFVSLFHMDAPDMLVEALNAGASDSMMLYNSRTRQFEPLDFSKLKLKLVAAPAATVVVEETKEPQTPPPSPSGEFDLMESEDSSEEETASPEPPRKAATARGSGIIEILTENDALPPCMMMCQKALKSPAEPTYKHADRLEDVKQFLSTGLVDIEDLVEHVGTIERALPMRAAKVEEHVREIRGARSTYEKALNENVYYEEKKYGSVKNVAGALSCYAIGREEAQKRNGARIRCPYALYAKGTWTSEQLNAAVSTPPTPEQLAQLKSGHTHAALSVCAAQLNGPPETQSLCIKYPRDYTRLALHVKSLKQEGVADTH